MLYHFYFGSYGCLKHHKFFSTSLNLHFFHKFEFLLNKGLKTGVRNCYEKGIILTKLAHFST